MSSTLSILCPVCGSSALHPVLQIENCPLHCNVLLPDQASALEAARAEIDIVFCKDCTHTFNRAFRSELLSYEQGYENSLYFSPTFRRYAEELACELTARFSLYEKRIVEIGSGDGQFLEALCKNGSNTGFGFDPSVPPRQVGEHLTFIADLFSERYAGLQADFVCCRHVLEHIDQPLAFLEGVKKALSRQSDTGLYFEVPNAAFLLEAGSIWDFIYPHVSYFSARSLRHLFELAGFTVDAVAAKFGTQFLGLEASGKLATSAATHSRSEEEGTTILAANDFGHLYRSTRYFWDDLINREHSAGRRVVLWGAGAKSVSFVCALSNPQAVSGIVDVNPRKHYHFIPGAGTPIVPPESLIELRPDLVLIVNPIYQPEIERDIAQMGLTATRVQALHVVNPIAA